MKKSWRLWSSVFMLVTVLVFTGCATTGTQSAVSGPLTTQQIVAQAKAAVPELTVVQAKTNMDKRSYKVILDVREPNEFRAGHIPGAMNIPRGLLEFQVSGKIPEKSTALLVYCKTGGRGVLASETLQKMGYNNVTNMDGGWVGWEKAGYPVE